jgi:hypothetical protein
MAEDDAAKAVERKIIAGPVGRFAEPEWVRGSYSV